MSEQKNSSPWEHGQEIIELTILRAAPGGRATKVFTPEEVLPYSVGVEVSCHSRAAVGLPGLYRLLGKVSQDPRAFVVRGVPAPHANVDRMNRRYLPDPQRGEPDMMAADQRWLCVDLDGIANPGLSDPDERAAYLIEQLPPCFWAVGHIVQWSASAGRDGWAMLKAHVWFILDRPAYCKSWRAYWAARMEEGWGPVDHCLYQAVQPHYTADPIFEGVEDPCAGARLYYYDGPALRVPAEVVDLATWQTEQEEIRRARAAAQERALTNARARMATRSERSVRGQREGYARAALRRAVEAIAACSEGSRHDTIRDQAVASYGLVLAGALAHDVWWDALEAAGMARLGGEGREREVIRLLESATSRAEARDLSLVGVRP
jgi:hypothetical protein